MTQRNTPPLAYSEYVSRDSNNSTEVWNARAATIEIIKQIRPEMLQKLAAEVFPIYSELACQDTNLDKVVIASSSPFRRLAEESPLKSALLKWASEFHVDADWLLDDALRNFRLWRSSPDWRTSLRWNSNRGRAEPYVNGGTFEFECEGWEPQARSWSDYCTSARKRFEEKLTEYERATRKLAEDAGLVRSRHTYSPRNLEWFAKYQFANMSCKEIADWASKNPDAFDDGTVLKGIKAAARLIGWNNLRGSK